MSTPPQERHLLVIEDDRGKRLVALDAATYSIGRDHKNAIVLHSETVSRQHAMLLRVPTGPNRYAYRLMDGNASGKPSANGLFVNGDRCSQRDLQHDDQISFGSKVKAAYQIVSMADQEFAQYVESITYRSIKTEAVNPKATMVSGEFLDGEFIEPDIPEPLWTNQHADLLKAKGTYVEPEEPALFAEPAKPKPAVPPQSLLGFPKQWLQWGAIALLGLGILAGVLWWWQRSQTPPAAPQNSSPLIR